MLHRIVPYPQCCTGSCPGSGLWTNKKPSSKVNQVLSPSSMKGLPPSFENHPEKRYPQCCTGSCPGSGLWTNKKPSSKVNQVLSPRSMKGLPPSFENHPEKRYSSLESEYMLVSAILSSMLHRIVPWIRVVDQ